jgi:hypothetical protein
MASSAAASEAATSQKEVLLALFSNPIIFLLPAEDERKALDGRLDLFLL